MAENKKRPIVLARRKKAPIRTVIALIVAGGAYLAYKEVQQLFNPRTPVAYSKQLLSTYKFPKPITSYPFYEMVELKVNPKWLAIQMGNAMTGITQEDTMTPYNKLIVQKLTYNDVRAIHNAFLKYVDQGQSLYDWIGSEWASAGKEEFWRDKALLKLDKAGVGKTNVLKIPVKDMLLI
jgi:hypothetical protein